jgi:uncharacterized protein (DUF433 family)
MAMAGLLDWSQCPDVESVAGKLSGAWVLRGTRMPVSLIFESLEYGSTLDEIVENHNVTREQIQSLLEFVALSASASKPAAERVLGESNACAL